MLALLDAGALAVGWAGGTQTCPLPTPAPACYGIAVSASVSPLPSHPPFLPSPCPFSPCTPLQVLKHEWVMSRGGILPRPLGQDVVYGAATVASIRRLRNLCGGACLLERFMVYPHSNAWFYPINSAWVYPFNNAYSLERGGRWGVGREGGRVVVVVVVPTQPHCDLHTVHYKSAKASQLPPPALCPSSRRQAWWRSIALPLPAQEPVSDPAAMADTRGASPCRLTAPRARTCAA